MSDLADLEEKLRGCTHANINKLGEEYFTADFLESMANGLNHAVRTSEDFFLVEYQPSEFIKCVIHYCVRNLIRDLWEFSSPRIAQFVDENGRFDLEKALSSGDYGSLSDDMTHNLDVGRKIIYGITSEVYDNWIGALKKRRSLGSAQDPIPLMYAVYKLHSVLLNDGDWQTPSIMDATFTSAGRENFDWLLDYPHLSRQEIEAIVNNSIDGSIEYASKLAINSTAKEQIVRELASRDELAYVLDIESKKIIFNPKYLADVQTREEELREGGFFDNTNLLLTCPAKFVPSNTYNGGSMLHDFTRFKHSAFAEIYLATHDRK